MRKRPKLFLRVSDWMGKIMGCVGLQGSIRYMRKPTDDARRTSMNHNDGMESEPLPGIAEASERRAWQTPDMEIVLVSATAAGPGVNCEGSIITAHVS